MIRDLDPTRDRAAVEDLFARAADHTALERGPTPPARTAREFLEGPSPSGADPARILRLGPVGRAGLDGIAETAFGVPEATDVYLGLLLAPEARGPTVSWWWCSMPTEGASLLGAKGFGGWRGSRTGRRARGTMT